MRTFLIVIVLFLVAPLCYGQKTPVEILNKGEDAVGQRLVFALKEAIRSSTSMVLTAKKQKIMIINIVTLDPDENLAGAGYSTVYSVAWLFDAPSLPRPYYLHSYIGICGTQRVRECAEGLVALTDKQIEKNAPLFMLSPSK